MMLTRIQRLLIAMCLLGIAVDYCVSAELEEKTTNSVGMKFVLVQPGEFLMGTHESVKIYQLTPLYAGVERCFAWERPQHRVKISRPIYMGVTEVTQGQWTEIMQTRPWADKSRVEMARIFQQRVSHGKTLASSVDA